MPDNKNNPEDGCKGCMTRRKILEAGLGAAGVGLIGAMTSVFGTIKPQTSKANIRKPVTPGDKLVYAQGPKKGQVLTLDSIKMAKGALLFPKGKEEHLNLIIMIHEKESLYKRPTHLKWVLDGVVAYSAICTHMGCTVTWHPTNQQPAPYPHIFCPCHQSMYNIFKGAEVVSGPAPRPLPQLPIKINSNNHIVADGDFDGPVGSMV